MTTLLRIHAPRFGYAFLAALLALLSAGYADITGFDQANFTLNGNAHAADVPIISEGVLTLTSASDSQATSAFFNEPQTIANFTASFTYDFLNGSSNPEGGFAFVLQNVGPNALGASGAGLGYGGIDSSVAVTFNIRDTNGISMGFNGSSLPFDITQIQLTGENPVHIRIDYAKNAYYSEYALGVRLTDSVTGATESRTFVGAKHFGLASNIAFVGFTGGTGDGFAGQALSDFLFTTNTGFTMGGRFSPMGFNVNYAHLSPHNQSNLGGGTDASRLENIAEGESLLSDRVIFPDLLTSVTVYDRINKPFILGGDQFAINAEGYVDLNGDGMDGDSGTFTLYVNSNDGFRLRLNDQIIGQFEGLTESSDTTIPDVDLKDGDRLTLTFFSAEGSEELALRVGDKNGAFLGSSESGIAIWPTPIPEPSTGGLLALGTAAITLCRRRGR